MFSTLGMFGETIKEEEKEGEKETSKTFGEGAKEMLETWAKNYQEMLRTFSETWLNMLKAGKHFTRRLLLRHARDGKKFRL